MSKLQRYRLVEDTAPSRLSRMLTALRSYTLGPFSTPDVAGLVGTQPVSSGVPVNEWTALNYSAVWSAVELLSSDIAALPLVLSKKDQEGGRNRFETHPLYRLIHDAPNPEMTAMTWRQVMQAHAMTWGNGYSEIVRSNGGAPLELWPLTPDRVTPLRAPNGALVYRVVNPSGGQEFFDARDILHLHGLGWNGTQGYSVLHMAREAIGLGLATEKFGGAFFGNGATFGQAISFPGEPTELAKKNFRETMARRHQGVENAHKMLALYGGATITSLGVPPDDAQFLSTRQFQVVEIARWFNIPPHKLGDLSRSGRATLEQQNTDYYISAMLPWLKRWEQEMMLKLVAPSERNIQVIEHIVEGMLRGDSAARGEFHSKQFSVASITPNEIREIEGRNKIPGGDRAFVALNLIPLDRVDEWVTAQIDAKKPAPTPAAIPNPPGNPDKVRELEEALALARRKAQEAEDGRDYEKRLCFETLDALGQEKARHEATKRAATDEHTRLTAQATALGTDLATAVEDLKFARMDAEEANALTKQMADHHKAAVIRAEAAERLVEERQQQIEAISLDVEAAQQETTRANERAEAAEHKMAITEAVVTELRSQIDVLKADNALRQVAVDAQTASLAAAATRIEHLEAGRATLEHTLETQAAELQQAKNHRAETAVAIRAAVVDRLSWLVERETDRARKAQASPEKLAKWIDSFYPMHDELCREILRPSLRAWVICTGHPQPADALLDALVGAHIQQSVRQLQSVAAEHNEDSLAPALEKVLRRWEADRAETTADRLLREAA